VIQAGAEYHAPAKYDELIEIETRLTGAEGVRVRFDYRVTSARDARVLSKGFTVHASCGRDGRPIRLPETLRARLAGHGGRC
jgi:acyl-CoA thioester hydrolase